MNYKLVVSFILGIILIIVFESCDNRKITAYYEYEDINLTRVDDHNYIYIFNGRLGAEDIKTEKYLIKFEKVRDGGTGFLLRLNKDHSIDIAQCSGMIEEIAPNVRITSRDSVSTSHYNSPEIAKLYGKHRVLTWADSVSMLNILIVNTIYISDYDNREKQMDSISNSKIKREYLN